MDELFFWIDETENILTSKLTLDTQYLADLLEKVKVELYFQHTWLFSCSFVTQEGNDAIFVFNKPDYSYQFCMVDIL